MEIIERVNAAVADSAKNFKTTRVQLEKGKLMHFAKFYVPAVLPVVAGMLCDWQYTGGAIWRALPQSWASGGEGSSSTTTNSPASTWSSSRRRRSLFSPSDSFDAQQHGDGAAAAIFALMAIAAAAALAITVPATASG
eukprot:GSA120T00013978001.1